MTIAGPRARGRARWWLAAWVVACALANPYVRGDGNGYYAWLVSPAIDGDLDFTNQFRRADPPFQTIVFDEAGAVRADALTPTGRVGNQWSVGPAVLWAPWFAIAHAGVHAARWTGADIEADGYSWPYLWLVSIGTVTYGMLALWLSARVAHHLGLGDVALVAAAGIGLASSLPVYQVFLPFHVHALAAFSVAAFVAYWVSRPSMVSLREWAVWGALAGLMVQVYQLNGIFLIAAAIVWAQHVRVRGLMDAVCVGVAFALAGFAVCLPQMIGKAIVYGSPFRSGYADEFFWSDPRLWETLWSANHGWWLWTPVAALACLGWLRLWRLAPQVRPLLVSAVLFYVAVASYQNWHGQSSFGNRFFLSLTVLQVAGLAALMADTGGRARRLWVAGLAGLAVWNAGFIFQWGTNIIPNRGAVDFREVAINQVTVVPSRLAGFVVRYAGDRRAAQETIERDDTTEQGRHRVVR